ncbi:hypothetical protein CEXT_154651 [Caerostris extrusa]|uniref:Uncharacterized protein n=1 Tax=Caerostris extrusa TaxID=172846 RepID=A0AAV4SVL5_CAEEX|nr:hypothetical protein CEXT_154651 [Caerostris extrusa]
MGHPLIRRHFGLLVFDASNECPTLVRKETMSVQSHSAFKLLQRWLFVLQMQMLWISKDSRTEVFHVKFWEQSVGLSLIKQCGVIRTPIYKNMWKTINSNL